MPKSCFLFIFLLVNVLWFTVHEVESGKNDLQYWKPTRDTRTTTVQTDDSYTDDSDDNDNKDDDSTEDSNAGSGDEGTDDETQGESDTEDEGRRNEIETNKDKSTTRPTTTTKKKREGIPIDELSPFSIARQLPEFKCMFPEANITQEIIGRTVEFNDIVLLRVTERKFFRAFRAGDNDNLDIFVDEAPPKKIVFIVHGLSVMGFNSLPCFKEEAHFTTLLSYYFNHLDKFDIFLIPMANPDGVALNRDFWNKNNSPQTDCPGVSLDRNFDVAWNDSRGISSCTQHYPGPAPFSEPETVAIRELFHRYSNRIVAYLHVHAGTYYHDIYKGDAVLYPKGYTEVQSDDDKYIDLKGDIDEAMRNASFRFLSVAVESLNSWYGPISGSSVDYASTVYGIPYAMEVVFQIYDGDDGLSDPMAKEDAPASNNMALVEIWRRIIDVIFNNIWKNSRLNDLR